MILTGPEIRRQIESGKRRHGKRMMFVPETGEYLEVDQGTPVHDKMNYIDVEPYEPDLVGPNSIDLRLGNELLVYEDGYNRHRFYESQYKEYTRAPKSPLGSRTIIDGESGYCFAKDAISIECILDLKAENKTYALSIPEDGLILWPGVLYLGRTIEVIGSNSFVPIVEGRSSVGRLGVHVHVTAGFCDLGFRGSITLEIHCLHPIRVYPGVPICQAYFLEPCGEIELYKGRYQGQVKPTASRFGIGLPGSKGDDGCDQD